MRLLLGSEYLNSVWRNFPCSDSKWNIVFKFLTTVQILHSLHIWMRTVAKRAYCGWALSNLNIYGRIHLNVLHTNYESEWTRIPWADWFLIFNKVRITDSENVSWFHLRLRPKFSCSLLIWCHIAAYVKFHQKTHKNRFFFLLCDTWICKWIFRFMTFPSPYLHHSLSSMSYSPHKDDSINLILLLPASYAMIYNRISNELDRQKSQDYENAYRWWNQSHIWTTNNLMNSNCQFIGFTSVNNDMIQAKITWRQSDWDESNV